MQVTIVDSGEELAVPSEMAVMLEQHGIIYRCTEPGDHLCEGEFYHIDPEYGWDDIDKFLAA